MLFANKWWLRLFIGADRRPWLSLPLRGRGLSNDFPPLDRTPVCSSTVFDSPDCDSSLGNITILSQRAPVCCSHDPTLKLSPLPFGGTLLDMVSQNSSDADRICPTCEVIVNWALTPRELGKKETLPWHPNPRSWFRTITSCPFCELVGRFVFRGYFTHAQLSERKFFADVKSVSGATRVTWMVLGNYGGKEEELSVLALEDDADAMMMDFWMVTSDCMCSNPK